MPTYPTIVAGNTDGAIPGVVLGLATLLLTGAGCAPHRAGLTVRPTPPFYPLGIWYGVESVPSAQGADLAARLEVDLATVGRMGLNTVFFRHVDTGTFPILAAAARRRHLRMVLPDRSSQYYIMTGHPESYVPSASWGMEPGPGSLRGVLWAVDLGWAVDQESAVRLEQVAAVYRANSSSPPTFAQMIAPVPLLVGLPASAPAGAEARGRHGQATEREDRSLMILRCDQLPDENSTAAERRWLGDFHAALARGLTGGLVVDQYRCVPGHGSAVADATGAVGLERINTIKRIVGRMQRWGPLLDGLAVKPFPAPAGGGDRVGMRLFARQTHRFLLVFNRSCAESLRATVTLEEVIDGLPVKRLVEVPGEVGVELGAVTETHHGGIALALDLAPGDARLYEVF